MMVCAQLVAFGRVSMRREERRERARRRREKVVLSKIHSGREVELGNGYTAAGDVDHTVLTTDLASQLPMKEIWSMADRRGADDTSDGSDGSFVESTDSEVIL